MDSVPMGGCYCRIAAPSAPTDAVVYLHPMLCDADVFARCVDLDGMAAQGVAAVCPESLNPIDWDLRPSSMDAAYLNDKLPAAILARWSTIERVHVVGFSQGGHMAYTLAMFGHYDFASYWQVCATCTSKQIGRGRPDLTGVPVFITLGAYDPLVPVRGNLQCAPMATVASAYEEMGASVKETVEQMGHGYPGGDCPPLWPETIFGGWPLVPPTTPVNDRLIEFIRGLTS